MQSSKLADDLFEVPLGTVVKRAASAIVKYSDDWPKFDKRIDLNYDVEVYDSKIGRIHRVRVRVRFTAESLIFHGPED